MPDIKRIDEDGVWYHNTGEFPIPDYGRASEMVMLQPGVVTQIKDNDYLRGQPTLVKVEDPFKVPPKKKAEPKPAE